MSDNQNGKGDTPRPCNKKLYDKNFDAIFRKKEDDKKKKK